MGSTAPKKGDPTEDEDDEDEDEDEDEEEEDEDHKSAKKGDPKLQAWAKGRLG